MAKVAAVLCGLIPLTVGTQLRSASRLSKADTPQDRVIFMHVNDCGGTSFMTWMSQLENQCSLGKMQECGPAKKVCKMGFRHDWPENVTCGGFVKQMVDDGCTFVELHHYDYSVVEAFKSKGFKMMTMLREPVPRVQSVVNMAIAVGQTKVEEALSTSKQVHGLFNSHTFLVPDKAIRLLSGCGHGYDQQGKWSSLSARRAFEGNCVKDFKDDVASHFKSVAEEVLLEMKGNAVLLTCDQGTNITNEEALDGLYKIAAERLQAFDFVGTLEQMAEIPAAFGAMFGMTIPDEFSEVPFINTHPKEFVIHSELAGEMQRALKLDYELWKQAQSLFPKMRAN